MPQPHEHKTGVAGKPVVGEVIFGIGREQGAPDHGSFADPDLAGWDAGRPSQRPPKERDAGDDEDRPPTLT